MNADVAGDVLAEIEGRAEGAIDIYQMKSFDIVIAATRGYASAIDALLMAEALRVVLALHRRGDESSQGYTDTGYGYIAGPCLGCEASDEYAVEWSCETVTAITAALGCEVRK